MGREIIKRQGGSRRERLTRRSDFEATYQEQRSADDGNVIVYVHVHLKVRETRDTRVARRKEKGRVFRPSFSSCCVATGQAGSRANPD